MLSIQEVHFYNNLVESDKVHNVLMCPINASDIVVTKVDEDDRPYYYCISCRTTFRITKETEKAIKLAIDKFLK